MVNKNGCFSEEAVAVFASSMQAEFALQRDRQNMGRRYMEVFRCRKQDYYEAIAAEVKETSDSECYCPLLIHSKKSHNKDKDRDQMDDTEILTLRGLPSSVTKSEIMEFFAEFKLSEDNIHIAYCSVGRVSGEAFVDFASDEDAKKAKVQGDDFRFEVRAFELRTIMPLILTEGVFWVQSINMS
ncbi:uncharacterized protein LOC143886060 [Tasmannia lanceolata]|uniref:uncharacterized protein LOC143886060 n=1 Tax=Tasmannia lanceolata TaxID=3420 RepID=UPI00406301A6